MRTLSVVFGLCMLAFVQVVLADPIIPVNPTEVNQNSANYYYLDHAASAVGSFGVDFGIRANYLDPVLSTNGQLGAIPNPNTDTLFPLNIPLPYSTLAQVEAAFHNDEDAGLVDYTHSSIVNNQTVTVTEKIGRSSFTPRSEIATASFGEMVWVLGGYDVSFYPGRTSTPQEARNDVHVSLDSGSTWAEIHSGVELDSTTPLHWSTRRGAAAVAYRYTGPFSNGKPAYYAPCPSALVSGTGATAQWGPLTASDAIVTGGLLPAGCTNVMNVETAANPNQITNFIQVQTNNLIEYGASFTGLASAAEAITVGKVPYPSGKAVAVQANTPIASALAEYALKGNTMVGSYVALLMTGGRAGVPSQSFPIADAWLSLDFGMTWTLQCFTYEQVKNIGPAGSSVIPSTNTNYNSLANYNRNLNDTATVTPTYTGFGGFYPGGVATCGFNARSFHTMVAVPPITVGGDATVLLMGGALATGYSTNDVWRSTNNGQTWTQINGCDYANKATLKFTDLNGAKKAIRAYCQTFGNPVNYLPYQYIPGAGAWSKGGPTIFASRNQFASTIMQKDGQTRVFVIGGYGVKNDMSDVMVSDDIVTQPGVQASMNNYIQYRANVAGNVVPVTQNLIGSPDTSADYGAYQYNLYGHWSLLKADGFTQFYPRRGHSVSYLACLNKLFLIGGDAQEGNTNKNQLASRNDVWYSSDGATWTELAANGDAGLFPKRDMFGFVSTSTSFVVMAGQIQIVDGPQLAVNLLNTNVYPTSSWSNGIVPNNGHPFYGDVWSTRFATYSYGPYGPCQCDANAAHFGYQKRAHVCSTGDVAGSNGCCIEDPIVLTKCSCYRWSAPYFVTDYTVASTPANYRKDYSADYVAAQCQADEKCDTYPDRTFIYAQADCYDITGYNAVNYTIKATDTTKTYYIANGEATAFVASGAKFSNDINAAVNTLSYPVVKAMAPYAGYQNVQRNGDGHNSPITTAGFLDARDNPCDGYVNSYLPGQAEPSTYADQLSTLNSDLVSATTYLSNAASVSSGAPYCSSDARFPTDVYSKDSCYYNNLGLARAYYMNVDSLHDAIRLGFLTTADHAYNLYQGFYFQQQRQPQLIFDCHRPICRQCHYTNPTFNSGCAVTCGGYDIPMDEGSVKCVDQYYNNVNPVLKALSLTPVPVAVGSGTYAAFGRPDALSCCTNNFNLQYVNAAGQTTSPYSTDVEFVNPYGLTNIKYPATTLRCATEPCPIHVVGDPEFLGFQGQKYEIHGIPDAVFAIISSPLVQYNARFVYIGHKSKHACDAKRTHPWTHAGTYLGQLGFKTAGGDEIILQSGNCIKGIRSVIVNGKYMHVGQKVSLKQQVAESSVHQSIEFKDAFTVVLSLAEFDIVLTNSDHFFNQEVSMTAFGEDKLQSHGLLGQTWKNEAYVVDGVKRVIEGVPTDYLIADDDILGDSFAFSKFNKQ